MATNINYLLVFLAIVVGLATSWEDIKFGKIRNKWILLGLAGGIALQAAALAGGFLPAELILSGLLNALIALLVGYLFWYFDLWAAGDAKLFFIFALLLPLTYYWRAAPPYFPSFVILINTFIPLWVFLLGQSLFFFSKKLFVFGGLKKGTVHFSAIKIKQKLLGLKKDLINNYAKYLKITIGFLLIFFIFQAVRLEADYFLSEKKGIQIVILFLIVAVSVFLRRIFQKNWVLVLFVLGLIVYFIFRGWFLGETKIDFFVLINGSILFFAAFGLISLAISFYIKSVDKKHLHFAIWLFLGVILTLVLRGSLLRFIF